MRRWIVAILAFLTAGAVINVAVASWFALTTRPMPVRDFRNLTPEEVHRLWEKWGQQPYTQDARPTGMLQITVGRDLFLAFATDQTNEVDSPGNSKSTHSFGIGQFKFGWPCRATELIHLQDSTKPSDEGNIIIGGLPVTNQIPDLGASVVGAIPLRPLWGGFAVNTFLYALVLMCVLAIPIAAIRIRRWRRGRCPSCGYPLGVSDRCTECGRQWKVTACRTTDAP
jgi:hypothetical protein